MRVAILSATETLSNGALMPRGFARIGGKSVLQRQLEFALELGCERIVCISNDLPSELVELQHAAETGGAKFQIIRDIKPLSGLVNASDEILVIADGLAFEPDTARELIREGRRILALPAEDAVPVGFERLNSDAAWAGIFLASGALVEKLAAMPSYVDPQSSLLRLAFQAETRMEIVPRTTLFDHQWMVIRSEEDLSQFEAQWLRGASSPSTFFSPIRAAADRAALAVMRRHSRPEKAARIVEGISVASLVGAGGLAFLNYPVSGLLVTALAGFTGRFSGTLSSILAGSATQSRIKKIWQTVQPIVIDVLLLALIVVSVSSRLASGAFFAAFMTLGLIRLIEHPSLAIFPSKLRELLADRAILAVFLAGGMLTGNITLALQLFAGLLLLLILLLFYRPKLTQA